MLCKLYHDPKTRGFSLVELLVVVAMIAILGSLAAPSFVDYGIRNNLRTIGNDFSASILKSRNEAVGKNTCVTMCMSTTVDTTVSGTTGPKCSTSGADWQVGWIVFLNESCNTAWTYPRVSSTDSNYDEAGLIVSRRAISTDYLLNSQSGTATRRFDFNSRGNQGLGSADEFDLIYLAANNPKTLKYAFNICVDKLGRTRTIPSASACSTY